MTCLVIDLHLPSGELLKRQVVEVDCGVVVSVFPFVCEFHSMELYDEAFIVPLNPDEYKTDMHTRYRYDGGYACLSVKGADGLLYPVVT